MLELWLIRVRTLVNWWVFGSVTTAALLAIQSGVCVCVRVRVCVCIVYVCVRARVFMCT